MSDLPELPVSFDRASQADQVSYREPLQEPFVELTQALTWIAFGISLSHAEFSFMESNRFGPFAGERWSDTLRAAMSAFASKANAGRIRVRGRYFASYSDYAAAALASTEYLSDTQLRDFARFDSLYGGLDRGTGLAGELTPLGEVFHSLGDGWRDVEVCRAGLLNAFPARSKCNEKPATQRKPPGIAADPDWPNAIAKVTQDCIATGYIQPLKHGDKAAIQTMLLSYMADKDKHFSDDTARKYAEAVIAALPDN